MEPVVTVGLDGSPESLAAADWAAEEAERRTLALHMLHAWPSLAPEPARLPAEADQNYWANRLVRTACTEVEARHPSLSIVTDLVADDAETALLDAASRSEMLVLGSRGLAPAESYFLGDVSLPVVARAQRPVVLVRADTQQDEPAPAATEGVVAALKLRGSCDDLLDFAFRSATARQVPLRVVHGRSVPLHARGSGGVDHTVAVEMARDAHDRLAEVLRPWREKYPGVAVKPVFRVDGPAGAVAEASTGAALLVVGRRRHRTGRMSHLGPVAQAAVHHGRCPVAVVPHD
ncbi:universal stress protein [Streptomyces levis]|uniref:Universal stress protein n=1 Tax=Streptomyces levis TaxID=285566 RepID=A0ABN3P0M0_9ACTN